MPFFLSAGREGDELGRESDEFGRESDEGDELDRETLDIKKKHLNWEKKQKNKLYYTYCILNSNSYIKANSRIVTNKLCTDLVIKI